MLLANLASPNFALLNVLIFASPFPLSAFFVLTNIGGINPHDGEERAPGVPPPLSSPFIEKHTRRANNVSRVERRLLIDFVHRESKGLCKVLSICNQHQISRKNGAEWRPQCELRCWQRDRKLQEDGRSGRQLPSRP